VRWAVPLRRISVSWHTCPSAMLAAQRFSHAHMTLGSGSDGESCLEDRYVAWTADAQRLASADIAPADAVGQMFASSVFRTKRTPPRSDARAASVRSHANRNVASTRRCRPLTLVFCRSVVRRDKPAWRRRWKSSWEVGDCRHHLGALPTRLGPARGGSAS